MLGNTSFYVVALIFASACGLVALGVTLARWRSHGAMSLILLLGGLSAWSLAYAFHWASREPQWKFFWLNMTYFGVVTVPAALFIFAFRYTGKDAWITPARLALFLIEPVAALILAWTDPQTGWFFAGKRALTDSVLFDGTPLFWFHVLYSYGLLLTATGVLFFHGLRSRRRHRRQIGIFLVSLLLPWAVNILGMSGLMPFRDIDFTPIVFTFTAIVILYNMLSQRWLDIRPIARDTLVDNMEECLIVADNHDRIVDFNASANAFFSQTLEVGHSLEALMTRWSPLLKQYQNVEQLDAEIESEKNPSRFYELRVRPIRDRRNELIGRLFLWHNITARKETERALQNANQELQTRINEIEGLQGQLRDQSIRDALTGVYNRRYLDETLEREFERAKREDKPLTVAIIDLDDFKSVNDTFGHSVGDLTLQQIAKFFLVYTRKSDIVCRYGGEEFVVVMPGLDSEIALTRAAGWRKAIEELNIESPKGSFQVTVSIGVAVYPHHAASLEALLRAADDALYSAKRDGKNRVAVSPLERSRKIE
ncbi:MAG: diguanylate cyclase [Anaerolineales bacterium]|nr:diguanylate cyclase [Anaerolineales bacterium]